MSNDRMRDGERGAGGQSERDQKTRKVKHHEQGRRENFQVDCTGRRSFLLMMLLINCVMC